MNQEGTDERGRELEAREILLQRFLDHDLEPEERIRFLEILERDAGLRRDLVEMERLVWQSAQLPRLTPPGDLKARVLRQLRAEPPGMWERVKRMLLTPHVFYWNPATALAVLGMLIAFAWGLGSYTVSDPLSPSGEVVTVRDQEFPVLVRLVLVYPEAQSVAVAGDFNGWTPDKTPLRQTREGVWAVTLKVRPGRYQYMYVIDGREWVTDPLAVEYSLDGFGSKNAVLDVEQIL